MNQGPNEVLFRPMTNWYEVGRRWAPDLAFGVIVAGIGLLEAATTERGYYSFERGPYYLLAIGVGLAVACCRRLPSLGLAIVWMLLTYQVLHAVPLLWVELLIAVLAFGCARWGSTATVVASGLSIPAAGLIGFALLASNQINTLVYGSPNAPIVQASRAFSGSWEIGAAMLGVTILGFPWLAGLVLRLAFNVRRSRLSQVAAEQEAAKAVRESEQAHEIATLQEAQARLAHDVHDVVGHSLAVILAQAETGPYLDDSDPEVLNDKLRRTMATIAESARSSLGDVRRVLVANRDQSVVVPDGGLEDLIDSIRRSGHDVRSTVIGQPRTLPPELESVAYRVLQEMLTNAMRHGQRDAPICVSRAWPEGADAAGARDAGLRIEVRNTVAVAAVTVSPVDGDHVTGGFGVAGMRSRLQSVGGWLDICESRQSDMPQYIAEAWVPIRDEGR